MSTLKVGDVVRLEPHMSALKCPRCHGMMANGASLCVRCGTRFDHIGRNVVEVTRIGRR